MTGPSAATVELHRQKRKSAILEALKEERRQVNLSLTSFRTALKDDPLEALGWIDSRVNDAAVFSVWGEAVRVLERAEAPEDVVAGLAEYCRAETQRMARSGAPRSTGVLAVEIWSAKLRAYARLLDVIEGVPEARGR